MKQPIKRSQFLKSIMLGIAAFFLDACRKPDPPAPTATNTLIPSNTPQPENTATPSPSPTPALPDFCQIPQEMESFLFGFGATRVTQQESGIYKIVIDKNINMDADQAQVEFVLIAELDASREYKVLWLYDSGDIVATFDAIYNSADKQMSATITGPRNGESGAFAAALMLKEEEAEGCAAHPDFAGILMEHEGRTYLVFTPVLPFDPVLVKSSQGGNAGKSDGSGSGGGPTSATNSFSVTSNQ